MSVDPEALSASLRRLVTRERELDSEQALPEALREVVNACVDLFAVAGSGIMLADEMNALRYVAASNGQAKLLEQLEAETMQGPCTDAYVYNRPHMTSDARADSRWPALRASLGEDSELRAVLGIPVKLGAVPVGTLDVFLDHPHEWTEGEQEALMRYGAVVQATLTSALAVHAAGEHAANLQYALDYRVVIERAVGYLMARDQLDAVSAFNRLRMAARSQRTKIGEIAQQLLDTGQLPGAHN